MILVRCGLCGTGVLGGCIGLWARISTRGAVPVVVSRRSHLPYLSGGKYPFLLQKVALRLS